MGDNGIGKTTFLNILALATGYLEQEKKLDINPLLKEKLEELDSNDSLEYDFHITSDIQKKIDLVITRKNGQKKISIDGVQVDSDALSQFEVVYLTQDDPKKVVTVTLGNIEKNFNNINARLLALIKEVNNHLYEIRSYHEGKSREQSIIDEINVHENIIEEKTRELDDLNALLKKIVLRDQLKEKINLLNNEEAITKDYEKYKKMADEIQDEDYDRLQKKLQKKRAEQAGTNKQIDEYKKGIIKICQSLRLYEVELNVDRLLKGDWSELNKLQDCSPSADESKVRIDMIDGLITFISKFPGETVVPLIEKPVTDVKNALYELRIRCSTDRVVSLINSLKRIMHENSECEKKYDELDEEINELEHKINELGKYGDIHPKYTKAAELYFKLRQIINEEDKFAIFKKWSELSSITDDQQTLDEKVRSIQSEIDYETRQRNSCKNRLETIREAVINKPLYEDREEALVDLIEKLTKLNENFENWKNIVKHPDTSRKVYQSVKSGFGSNEFDKFIFVINSYLGKYFEPMDFAQTTYKIASYDIENECFITEDDRKISLKKLSEGQEKIVAFNGSWAETSTSKQKIVLIDEISALSGRNLEKITDLLKEKYANGALLLAILMRPIDDSSKLMEIVEL